MKIIHVLYFLAAWAMVDLMALVLPLDIAVMATVMAGIVWHVYQEFWGDGKHRLTFTNVAAGGLGIWFATAWWSDYVLFGLWAFWVLYVFTMGLYRAFLAGRLKGLSLFMCSPFVVVAFVVDFIAQMTVFSVVFLDLPKHWLVTNRLRAYIAGPDNWRRRLADYLCHHLLDPFDPTGAHCDSDSPQLKA